MVTSMADSDAVKQAVTAGVTDFITKPVNWGQLSECIREHLQSSSPAPSTTA
jgi:FixJ family two-component response regulator